MRAQYRTTIIAHMGKRELFLFLAATHAACLFLGLGIARFML